MNIWRYIMADVYAVFGILLALGIAFPGMLTAVWLFFPRRVSYARTRLAATPWQTFWLGLFVSFVVGIPITILLASPSAPAKLIGGTTLVLVLTIATLGAAGLTLEMADRLQEKANGKLKTVPAFIGSAVALELAAFFPFIGWIVVIPLGIIISLGAATFALLRWMPRQLETVQDSPEMKREPQTV
jgi:hypothetical protein